MERSPTGSGVERSSICCPYCGALESVSSVVCHRCGKIIRQVTDVRDANAFLRREDLCVKILQWSYSIFFVVILFEAVRLGGSPFEALVPGEAFMDSVMKLGALSDDAVLRHGQWFRILTATFAHFGLLHLFFNTSAMSAVGPETEKNLGKGRFLFIYFATGILANIGSLAWHVLWLQKPFVQAGASGAICGLVGALYSIAKMRGGVYDQVVSRVVTRWVVMTALIGFVVPVIDNSAHLAGFISGMIMVRLIGLKKQTA